MFSSIMLFRQIAGICFQTLHYIEWGNASVSSYLHNPASSDLWKQAKKILGTSFNQWIRLLNLNAFKLKAITKNLINKDFLGVFFLVYCIHIKWINDCPICNLQWEKGSNGQHKVFNIPAKGSLLYQKPGQIWKFSR